ncbi:MAG: GntR family transcriptional regulator [Blastocatellia bacterium]
MHLWIVKDSEVSIHEQLATQIMLAIVSNDLKINQKLPSTRELARRLSIHHNTVTTIYHDLAERGWLEIRQGSGFYVRERLPKIDSQVKLDHLILSFLKEIRNQGFTISELQKQLPKWLEMEHLDHFLVIDPSKELRKLLVKEIHLATKFPVHEASVEDCNNLLEGAIPVAMYGRVDRAKHNLPANLKLLNSRSVQQDAQKYPTPPKDISIIVISYWPELLRWAKALLTAIGVESGNSSFRDARNKDWKEGINKSKSFLIVDILVAKELPPNCQFLIYKIISKDSLAELKELINPFS